MDAREEANRAVADYVTHLRLRLADGQTEIARQHASVDETRDHIAEMRRWQREDRGDAA